MVNLLKSVIHAWWPRLAAALLLLPIPVVLAQGPGAIKTQEIFSSTGAVTVYGLQDKGGQVFNVKAYGAKGDGVTDDSVAFQNAINAAFAKGGKVVLPGTSAGYRVNTALNLTNHGTGNESLIIEGTGGPGDSWLSSGPSVILANTGGVLFDTTGSINIMFRDLVVSAQAPGLTNPSTVGFLIARSTTYTSGGENINFENVGICMALGQATPSVGIYNFQGEEDTANVLWVLADYPVIFTEHNFLSLSSPYTTINNTAISAAQNSLSNAYLGTTGVGPGLYFDSFYDFYGANVYIWNYGSANPYPGGLVNYAVYIKNSSNIHIQGRNEGYPTFAYVDVSSGGQVNGVFIDGTHAPDPAPRPLCAVQGQRGG